MRIFHYIFQLGVVFPVLLWGQFTFFTGEMSFQYSGEANGTFYAETALLPDTSSLPENAALGFMAATGDTTHLLLPAYQQVTDSTYDVFVIYLRDDQGGMEPQTWLLPGELADLKVLMVFIPEVDSATVAAILAPLLDSVTDSTEQDSVLYLLLNELAGLAYFGISGSINLTTAETDSLSGNFNAVVLKPPVSTITIANGNFHFQATELPPMSLTDNGNSLPGQVRLHPNYPNPFNNSTVITFGLSEPAKVMLSIFDITGRKVALLANAEYPAGSHYFTWEVSGLAAGIYLVRLESGLQLKTSKILFLK